MSEIRVDSIGNESNTGGPVLSGITTFSGQQYFIPPTGTTAERPSDCPPGSVRFNTDTAHLEYWQGTVWLEFEASSEDLGDQNNSNSSGGTGARALTGGRASPSQTNIVDYVSIPTEGNAQDFGDMGGSFYRYARASSRTRGLFAGGQPGSGSQESIEFFTFASTGNGTDFGDLLSGGKFGGTGESNQTRGLFAGGATPTKVNTIEYVTIAQTGNAVDFGDLSSAVVQNASCCSSVRGIFAGGYSPSNTNTIDYVTFSTLGNAQDFGDAIGDRLRECGGGSSATRGLFLGGSPGVKTIQFLTMATTGNTQDFGDLITAVSHNCATSSTIRALSIGGLSTVNTIEFVTIATTGNGINFGDLTTGGHLPNAMSNDHGGL
jgi:hypothetical protein